MQCRIVIESKYTKLTHMIAEPRTTSHAIGERGRNATKARKTHDGVVGIVLPHIIGTCGKYTQWNYLYLK